MEVMLEIYRTLKTLGMEWKEKKNLGGLGELKARAGRGGINLERARGLDGEGGVDRKAASSIYFVETRARVQDVVVCTLSLFYLVVLSFLFHQTDSYFFLVFISCSCRCRGLAGFDEPPAIHG
jgi:carbon catabolite-derepressing protein kinase